MAKARTLNLHRFGYLLCVAVEVYMQPNPGGATWNRGLVGVGLAIASSDDPRLRVLAGPGTGKTFALKRLVMRLLERGDDPKRILVVTFTRTAAADLAQEMEGMAIPGCDEIAAGTLHSLCFRILNSNAALAVHNRVPRPLIPVRLHGGFLGFEYAPMLKDLGANPDLGDTRNRIALLRAYEGARQQQQIAGAARSPVDQQFEVQLVEWLSFHRAMLIGELIPETLKYLEANPMAPEHTMFDRVIVDEYQDLNKAEQTIIDLLAENGTLMIVGDQDQSIYSFRHANPEGIADFSNRHAGTTDLGLGQCRRCDHNIVQAANSLISYNHIGDAPPFTGMAVDPGRGAGAIQVIQWANIVEEIQGIADYVNHLVVSGAYASGDILIMTPRRRIGYAIRNALLHHGVDAHSFFHEEALETNEAQEAFALLTILGDNEDRVALRFWLGFGSDSWRMNQYTKLRAHCHDNGETPFEALTRMASGDLSATGYAQLLARFRELQAALAPLADLTGSALVDALFPADLPWAEPLRDILAGTDLDAFTLPTDVLKLVRDYVTQPEIPTHPNFVRIMSLHASKGLTSEVAIVASIVDSMIPNVDPAATGAEADRNMREQRRLFYVAITRGRQVLVLSSPARIAKGDALQMGARVGKNDRTFPSRFLGELGGTAPRAKSGAVWAASGYA